MMLNLDEAQRRQREIAKEANRARELATETERPTGLTNAITGLIRRAARPGKAAAEGRPALA
ncbi:MAG: hypothetical protein J0H25_06830 [Rhizobiales bacterium]|nr:hypothetical protein [Hyphomicrobiales bacterium]